jgi:hypothetical protein
MDHDLTADGHGELPFSTRMIEYQVGRSGIGGQRHAGIPKFLGALVVAGLVG